VKHDVTVTMVETYRVEADSVGDAVELVQRSAPEDLRPVPGTSSLRVHCAEVEEQ
jgi:hypothetical protein